MTRYKAVPFFTEEGAERSRLDVVAVVESDVTGNAVAVVESDDDALTEFTSRNLLPAECEQANEAIAGGGDEGNGDDDEALFDIVTGGPTDWQKDVARALSHLGEQHHTISTEGVDVIWINDRPDDLDAVLRDAAASLADDGVTRFELSTQEDSIDARLEVRRLDDAEALFDYVTSGPSEWQERVAARLQPLDAELHTISTDKVVVVDTDGKYDRDVVEALLPDGLADVPSDRPIRIRVVKPDEWVR